MAVLQQAYASLNRILLSQTKIRKHKEIHGLKDGVKENKKFTISQKGKRT
jgi:hypothetical protein